MSESEPEHVKLKAAFWEVFCGAGELWFPDQAKVGQDQADAAVEPYWQEFLKLAASKADGVSE